MPELPEVETVRRVLAARLTNSTIERVHIFEPVSVKEPSVVKFLEIIPGCNIKKINRKGKYLVFLLSHDFRLVAHLGMTGTLIYCDNKWKYNINTNHLRVVFDFDSSKYLLFVDPRKFGGLWLVKEEENFERLDRLGPDWWDEVTLKMFKEKAEKRKNSRLKALLLDQGFFSGLGNIYTDESLYRACLSPLREVGDLTPYELQNLYLTIKEILQEGMACGGTSTQNYLNANGEPGQFQEKLLVYQKEGSICFRCGKEISRMTVCGRGTFYCSLCQNVEADGASG